MSYVLDVQVERVRRAMRGLEDRQRLPPQMHALTLTLIEREHEAQIRGIRLQERQPSHIVCAVSRDDAQPGVQEIVRLVEQQTVVDGERLPRFRGLLLESTSVVPM